MPGGRGRDPPSLTAVQGSGVDTMVMTAFFTSGSKIKSEWVQSGGNPTELAWLLSL